MLGISLQHLLSAPYYLKYLTDLIRCPELPAPSLACERLRNHQWQQRKLWLFPSSTTARVCVPVGAAGFRADEAHHEAADICTYMHFHAEFVGGRLGSLRKALVSPGLIFGRLTI